MEERGAAASQTKALQNLPTMVLCERRRYRHDGGTVLLSVGERDLGTV
jgi:hypothetical protein